MKYTVWDSNKFNLWTHSYFYGGDNRDPLMQQNTSDTCSIYSNPNDYWSGIPKNGTGTYGNPYDRCGPNFMPVFLEMRN